MLVVAENDPLAKRRLVSLHDVIDREFIGLPRESSLQRHVAGHVARPGATMKLRVRVNGFDAVCRMAEAAVGIGIIPEVAARRCRRSMHIGFAHLSDEWQSSGRPSVCDNREAFQSECSVWLSTCGYRAMHACHCYIAKWPTAVGAKRPLFDYFGHIVDRVG